MTIKMYGDDFWIGLYPTQFDEFEVYPSLDITDLHNNDKLVKDRLLDQLDNYTDWDVIWTHVLGIDHAGHTYNTLGQGMDQKIKDVEQLLTQVIDNLPSNTTLAILSDHGLTELGTHGGSTEEELNTFIAFYHNDFEYDISSGNKNLTKVPQTSIAPTLSYLLGIPTPYSNIGLGIPSAVPYSKGTIPEIKSLEKFRKFKLNQLQILQYLSEYQSQSSFSSSLTTKIEFYSKKMSLENEKVIKYFREHGKLCYFV